MEVLYSHFSSVTAIAST